MKFIDAYKFFKRGKIISRMDTIEVEGKDGSITQVRVRKFIKLHEKKLVALFALDGWDYWDEDFFSIKDIDSKTWRVDGHLDIG